MHNSENPHPLLIVLFLILNRQFISILQISVSCFLQWYNLPNGGTGGPLGGGPLQPGGGGLIPGGGGIPGGTGPGGPGGPPGGPAGGI